MKKLPIAGILLCTFGLSACLDAPPGPGSRSAQQNTERGVRGLDVLQGAVRVRAPDGYCIDQSASRASTGFVVMTGCAIVSDARIMPTALALITLQVGGAGSAAGEGSAQAFVDLMTGPDGGTLLGGPRNATLIKVVTAEVRDGVATVMFTDRAPPPVAGLRDNEWRAFFDIGDRLVTLGLRGYSHTALNDAQGRSLLSAAVRSVKEANMETVPLANR